MKTIEQFEIIRETEKATLIKSFVSELDLEIEFWLPKSKFEINNDSIEIEDEIWKDKIDEFKTPKETPAVIIYIDKFEEKGNSIKLILSATLKKIDLHPWLFIPKSLVLDQVELDTEDEDKIYFKVPAWFWEKSITKLVDDQLEFFNKDREEEHFTENDFKLLTKVEE